MNWKDLRGVIVDYYNEFVCFLTAHNPSLPSVVISNVLKLFWPFKLIQKSQGCCTAFNVTSSTPHPRKSLHDFNHPRVLVSFTTLSWKGNWDDSNENKKWKHKPAAASPKTTHDSFNHFLTKCPGTPPAGPISSTHNNGKIQLSRSQPVYHVLSSCVITLTTALEVPLDTSQLFPHNIHWLVWTRLSVECFVVLWLCRRGQGGFLVICI